MVAGACVTQFPLWLMFLQGDGIAKDTPEGKVSPTGLYGQKIEVLKKCVDHTSEKYAKGMVYWTYSVLKLHATLEEIGYYD